MTSELCRLIREKTIISVPVVVRDDRPRDPPGEGRGNHPREGVRCQGARGLGSRGWAHPFRLSWRESSVADGLMAAMAYGEDLPQQRGPSFLSACARSLRPQSPDLVEEGPGSFC